MSSRNQHLFDPGRKPDNMRVFLCHDPIKNQNRQYRVETWALMPASAVRKATTAKAAAYQCGSYAKRCDSGSPNVQRDERG